MKFSKKILAAVLVLALAMSMVAALAATLKTDYVQFKGSAYGYEKAGSKKTKFIVKKGSVGMNLGSKGDWTLVCLGEDANGKNHKDLWFASKYLKETDAESSRIIYAAGGSGRSYMRDYNYIPSLKGKKIKATGKCNIRKTASLYGKSLGVFKKDTKMTLTGDIGVDNRGVVWYGVKYSWKLGKSDMKVAWVSEEYTNYKGKYTFDVEDYE